MQIIKAVKKGIANKGASFIEVLSQCPVHEHETPVDAMNALKEITVPVKKAEVYFTVSSTTTSTMLELMLAILLCGRVKSKC